MRRTLIAVVLVLLAGGCGSAESVAPQPEPPASTAPSKPAEAKPEPTYADLTQGNAESVVKVYSYDAKNRSAVVEPILFMSGADFCRTYEVKSSDPRCDSEWTTEESRTKVTVPVAAKSKFFSWQNDQGDVCMDVPDEGGTCPISSAAFAEWVVELAGEMAAITTEDGEITRMAQIYTP